MFLSEKWKDRNVWTKQWHCWRWQRLPEYSTCTFLSTYVLGLWQSVGTLFYFSQTRRHIRVSSHKNSSTNERIHLPDLQTPDAAEERSNHMHQWPLAPLFLPSHLRPAGSCRKLRCDRTALLLPTICSKCVEPSVCKTGRPRFPFSLGFVSLFSGASLLPVWLLGPGSGPTMGFLKWRSWGWGCRAHLLQAWGRSIINGAKSIGDSSDV